MRTYTHGVIGYLLYAQRPRHAQRLAIIGGILPDVFLALGFVAHYHPRHPFWHPTSETRSDCGTKNAPCSLSARRPASWGCVQQWVMQTRFAGGWRFFASCRAAGATHAPQGEGQRPCDQGDTHGVAYARTTQHDAADVARTNGIGSTGFEWHSPSHISH